MVSMGDTVVLASPLPATVTLTGKGAATLTDIQKQQVLALIDGDLESDFWQDVDAAEVADYCTRFLTAYKAR